MNTNLYTEKFNIDPKVILLGENIITILKSNFEYIDYVSEQNQLKIISAMQRCNVSIDCFNTSTGYGYDDYGRDNLEQIYSLVFNTESALVRPQITCGTHALSTVLFALLHNGDTLLSPAGGPYDTLEEVIGIRDSIGSLREYGVNYKQVDLLENFEFDYDNIQKALEDKSIKVATIQRSKGYQTRPSFTISKIKELIQFIKNIRPDLIVMVDNCYGEFVELMEPTDVGADIMAGSLIKNPGGGLAMSGGYIVGRKDLIDRCAYRLNSPGLGREVGASLGQLRSFYQGLFLSPSVVNSALKTALFASKFYEELGFKVIPNSSEPRTDIIQSIILESENALKLFCKGIQNSSAVDGHVTPVPSDMPGYNSQVIMACGSFVSGSSIELSADGPLREPYAVYLQGALTWPHGKLGILKSVQELYSQNLITIN